MVKKTTKADEAKKVTKSKKQAKTNTAAKSNKNLKPTGELNIYVDGDGNKYEVNSETKTFKKIASAFKDIDPNEISLDAMPLTIYQRYLKDRFDGESVTLKKDMLRFRDHVISCDIEEGFTIKDTHKKYAVVSNFDGIPTPKELGDWFERPAREFSAEETREAEERGKQALLEREEARKKAAEEAEEEEEPDYEELRKKVLSKIYAIQNGKRICEDPIKDFKDAIPFKQWRRKCNALLKRWGNREIRFKRFLSELAEMTEEQEFEVVEKVHRMTFQGTLLPTFKKVGSLIGNMLEVDDKKVYAVPFLVEYALHYEPKMMPQLMKYSRNEITAVDFIKEPIVEDWKEEYKKNCLENSGMNAKVISCAMTSAGLIPPQNLLYSDDLKVGDRIYLYDKVNDEWVYKDVLDTKYGITINNGVGLYKDDDFIVVGHRDILKLPYRFAGVDNNKDTEELNKEGIVNLNHWYKRLQAFYPFESKEVNGKSYSGVTIYFGKKEGDIYNIYGDWKKIMNRIRKFLMSQGDTRYEENEQRCLGERYKQPE